MSITTRIDRITAVPSEAMSPTPPIPRSVKVELTGRCNYRCGFCALRVREAQPVTDMDFGLFTRITREMRAAGVEELGLFFLGESFSNKELLIAATRHAKAIGFPYVFLTTNGSLADPVTVRSLMASGLDSLKFSINAADAQQFVNVMQVKPALFMRALDNLRAAREVRDAGRYNCGLYASSIKYDGAQQARMEAMLDEYVRPFVDEHYWLPLYSMGSLAAQRERELGYRPTAGNQGRLDAMRAPLPCWSAFTEGHVTATGKLSACCFDATEKWGMADLTVTPFAEAWHSAEFQRLRGAHLRRDVSGTVCEQCVAYK